MKLLRLRRSPRRTGPMTLVHASPALRDPANVPVARMQLEPVRVLARKPDPAPVPERRLSLARRTGTRIKSATRRVTKSRRGAPTPIAPGQRPRIIAVSRWLALLIISVVSISATSVAFVESYHGLYLWFHTHGFTQGWAQAAPLTIDSFMIIGELAIFVSIVDHWKSHTRIWAWAVIIGGLVASVGGNVGKVDSSKYWTWKVSAAAAPISAMLGMTIGFQVLKWVMSSIAERQVAESLLAETQPVASTTAEPVYLEPEPRPAPALSEIPRPRPALSESPAPTPEDKDREPLRAVWTPPEEPRQPDPAPKPAPRPQTRTRNGRHPRWDEGVAVYTKSRAEVLEGLRDRALSQRELAAALGMKNRTLAARVIDHVDNGGE